MIKNKKAVIEIAIVYVLLLAASLLPFLVGQIAKNYTVALIGKMVVYVIMLAIVIFACRKQKKEMFTYLGFSSEHILRQILVSFIPLILIVAIFIGIPLFSGTDLITFFGEKGTDTGKLIGDSIFFLLFVGPIEELIFRGYMMRKIREIIPADMFICLFSAMLYGFWHFPTTLDTFSVFCFMVIGFILALARLKIKNCTTLSAGLAHGLYETFLLVLGYVLVH